MSDYASQKVPELKKLLTDRGLVTTGNKPDLIARLEEDDQSKAAPVAAGEPKAGTDQSSSEASAAANVPTDTKEDEINYTEADVAAAAPAEPAAAAAAAAPAPAAAHAAAEAPAADAAPKETAPLFTLGLSSTAADDEARRRAARAKRFGIEEDDDSKKRAERASRFGVDEKEIGGLDSALPERGHKRGRGPRHEGDGNRPGKRQSLDRRGDGNRNNQNNRSNGTPKPKIAGILDNAAERAKAEARAARFAS